MPHSQLKDRLLLVVAGLLCSGVALCFFRIAGEYVFIAMLGMAALGQWFENRHLRRLVYLFEQGLYPPRAEATDEDVARLADRGEKVPAIRLYRQLHGGGLKAAKLSVEELERQA